MRIEVSRYPKLDANKIEGLNEALAEFTSERGREKFEWTDKTVCARLSIVSEIDGSIGRDLSMAYFVIYRVASQVLHGSFYGAVYFWNLENFESDKTNDRVLGHLLSCVSASMFAVFGMITAFERQYPSIGKDHELIQLIHKLKKVIGEHDGKFSSDHRTNSD
jgi:hypothetical protein